MTVAASGAKFYNIDSPLEVYYVRLDSHEGVIKRVPIRASIAYFKLFTDVGLYNNALLEIQLCRTVPMVQTFFVHHRW